MACNDSNVTWASNSTRRWAAVIGTTVTVVVATSGAILAAGSSGNSLTAAQFEASCRRHVDAPLASVMANSPIAIGIGRVNGLAAWKAVGGIWTCWSGAQGEVKPGPATIPVQILMGGQDVGDSLLLLVRHSDAVRQFTIATSLGTYRIWASHDPYAVLLVRAPLFEFPLAPKHARCVDVGDVVAYNVDGLAIGRIPIQWPLGSVNSYNNTC